MKHKIFNRATISTLIIFIASIIFDFNLETIIAVFVITCANELIIIRDEIQKTNKCNILKK